MEKKPLNKWIKKMAIVTLALALYNISSTIPKISETKLFNPMRRRVQNSFKVEFLRGLDYTEKEQVYDYFVVFPLDYLNTPVGSPYYYHSPEIPMKKRDFIATKRHPLLEGLTDKEFCEIVDSYNGPINYATIVKYIKKEKQKKI